MSFEPDSRNRDKKARPHHVRVSSQVCAVHGPSLFPAYSSQLIAYSCLEEAYETYGQATIYSWPTADVNSDGVVDAADVAAVEQIIAQKVGVAAETYADLNLDGDVDATDSQMVQAAAGQNAAAVELASSSLGNPYLFTGRPTDTLGSFTDPTTGRTEHYRIQDNRNRTYGPKHARWLEREPLGYVDGMNLYEYVRGRPSYYADYTGEQTAIVEPPPTRPPAPKPPPKPLPSPRPGPGPAPGPSPGPAPGPGPRPGGWPSPLGAVCAFLCLPATPIGGPKSPHCSGCGVDLNDQICYCCTTLVPVSTVLPSPGPGPIPDAVWPSGGAYVYAPCSSVSRTSTAVKKPVVVCKKPCKPCIPPVGTTAYDDHHGHEDRGWDPHTHHFKMHQNPTNCQCFWDRNYIPVTPGVSPAPGEIPLPGPAQGGGF